MEELKLTYYLNLYTNDNPKNDFYEAIKEVCKRFGFEEVNHEAVDKISPTNKDFDGVGECEQVMRTKFVNRREEQSRLTSRRNKLSRQITTLKKASLKYNVKCSSCGVTAITEVQDYPFTCGMCGKITMQYVSDVKKQ